MADKRLFFALWPDERQRDAMRAIIPPATSSIEGRISEQRNWHVTLVFIGGFDEGRIASLQQAVADIEVRPFRLRMERIAFWARPKIACLEASRTPRALDSLVKDLRSALAPFDVAKELHRYRPHITVARNARPFATQPLARTLELSWSEFTLVESVSSPRGVHYHPLKQQVRKDS